MTDTNYTALLLVIDRSGSMTGIRDDMVGGLQSLLADQAAEPGMLTVDIVTFDDVIEHTHAFADPATVQIELEPRGMTALHDAMGISITEFGRALAALPEHARPSTVQVVVVTDGGENSSREYSGAAVKKLVTDQTEKYGWDFVFLGANQDAVATGRDLGIAGDSAMTFAAAPGAVQSTTDSIKRYMKDVRGGSKRGFTEAERGDAAGE